MKRRTFLKLSVGSFVLLTVPASVPAAPATGKTAVEAVELYLSARRGNRLADAYALLSHATHQIFPFSQFDEVRTAPDKSSDAPPLVAAVTALFTDPRNASDYLFTVVGPAPGEPNVVLVHARAPGMKAEDILTLKIVAVPESETSKALRLDLTQTMQRTDKPGMEKARERARQVTSLSNLRQIGLALVTFAAKHGDRLPKADTWTDDILSQWKDFKDFQPEFLFHDPSAPESDRWSYAFNRALSGVKLSDLKDAANVVMAFESTAGVKNASDEGASIPHPGRHLGGTTYLFADGHARWISDREKTPSFRLDGE